MLSTFMHSSWERGPNYIRRCLIFFNSRLYIHVTCIYVIYLIYNFYLCIVVYIYIMYNWLISHITKLDNDNMISTKYSIIIQSRVMYLIDSIKFMFYDNDYNCSRLHSSVHC